MSRVGKKPISVPSGVRVTIDPQSRQVNVEGPKGKLSMTHRPEVSVTWDEGENRIICAIPAEQVSVGQMRAYWGLTRALIANMIVGVTEGYTKKLEINGVGYGAKVEGSDVVLNLGFSHPVKRPIPSNVTVTCPSQTQIVIESCDKQAVGEVAATIRKLRPPEPYKGKGIKYDDEIIRRKAGKAFGSA